MKKISNKKTKATEHDYTYTWHDLLQDISRMSIDDLNDPVLIYFKPDGLTALTCERFLTHVRSNEQILSIEDRDVAPEDAEPDLLDQNDGFKAGLNYLWVGKD